MLELEKVGYKTSQKIKQIMEVFYLTGKEDIDSIPTMLLTGASGVGKTFLAESFAKAMGAELIMLQCYPGMTSDNFIGEPNIQAILSKNSDEAIKDGILVRALKKPPQQPIVVLLDEIDKSSDEVDSFLLDFINSIRVTNGQEEWSREGGNLWLFLTSNGQRDLQEALLNRCRKVELERPSKINFLEVLNLPSDHYLGEIYEGYSNFSIRQAKSYLSDLTSLSNIKGRDISFNQNLLNQYVDFEQKKICSVEEFNQYSSLAGEYEDEYDEDDNEDEYEYEYRGKVMKNGNVQRIKENPKWIKFISDGKLNEFTMEQGEEESEFYIRYNKLSQAKILLEYGILSCDDMILELDETEINMFSKFQKMKAGKNNKEIGLYVFNDELLIKYFVSNKKQYIYVDSDEIEDIYFALGETLDIKTFKNTIYINDKYNWIRCIMKYKFNVLSDNKNELYINIQSLSEAIKLAEYDLLKSEKYILEVDIDLEPFYKLEHIKSDDGKVQVFILPYNSYYKFKCYKIGDKMYMKEYDDTINNICRYLKSIEEEKNENCD